MRIAVTGATGLVGFHAVRHLLKRGHAVTALVRESSDLSKLLELQGNLSCRKIDLFAPDALAVVLKGMDAVIHAAGVVDAFAPRKNIFRTNVDGTSAVLRAADGAGVKQFIHISSLSVITGQKDQFRVGEDAPLRYCGEAYADSKVDAEQLVMGYTARNGLNVTCLRPGFIYGSGEQAWMPRLIESLKTGQAMLIDGGGKETNVIYVENLCPAIEGAMLNPRAYGRVYNLTDGQHITKKELFNTICAEMGFSPPTKHVPGVVARSFCEAVSFIIRPLPVRIRKLFARYSPAAFRLVGVNQGFDISRAERELGYTYRIPFRTGMRETLQDYRRGMAPPCPPPCPIDAKRARTIGAAPPCSRTRNADFFADYVSRHSHPLNAWLHIAGVPMTFYGSFLIFAGVQLLGVALLLSGFVLQYLGHRVQGNEMGEITLIKHLWKRFNKLGQQT